MDAEIAHKFKSKVDLIRAGLTGGQPEHNAPVDQKFLLQQTHR